MIVMMIVTGGMVVVVMMIVTGGMVVVVMMIVTDGGGFGDISDRLCFEEVDSSLLLRPLLFASWIDV